MFTLNPKKNDYLQNESKPKNLSQLSTFIEESEKKTFKQILKKKLLSKTQKNPQKNFPKIQKTEKIPIE